VPDSKNKNKREREEELKGRHKKKPDAHLHIPPARSLAIQLLVPPRDWAEDVPANEVRISTNHYKRDKATRIARDAIKRDSTHRNIASGASEASISRSVYPE
jgi:hypothetical protein